MTYSSRFKQSIVFAQNTSILKSKTDNNTSKKPEKVLGVWERLKFSLVYLVVCQKHGITLKNLQYLL